MLKGGISRITRESANSLKMKHSIIQKLSRKRQLSELASAIADDSADVAATSFGNFFADGISKFSFHKESN